METVPLPKDLPLPLPAELWLLEVAAVATFLVHILFVALMLGGSLFSVYYEIRGRKRPELDRLAREIAKTITVNKSLAVVLGVAPLLVLNVLYSIYFYSANALTGTAWIMVVPLVATAFLLTYAHSYSWERLAGQKGLHIAIGGAGAALFLGIPFIFLANINLMLFPERWSGVHGFLSTLLLPNVLPRYLHFIIASVAVSSLFFAGWFGRRGFAVEERLPGLERGGVIREFLTIVFGATALQIVAGPLLFFTLPASGLSWALVGILTIAVVLILVALGLLWGESDRSSAGLGRRYWTIVGVLSVVVVLMAYGRHVYREGALAPHRARMAETTADYQAAVLAANMRAAAGMQRTGGEETAMSPGERTFKMLCTACHASGRRLVGPPIEEIAEVYRDNPAGLIDWVRAPGRKRLDYPEMPPMRMSEAQYQAVADYVLGLGQAEEQEPAAE
jgi:cytochrome c